MNCSLNKLLTLMLLAAPLSFPYSQALAADSPELPSVSQTPLFLSGGAPAMVMLVMGRDHTLFTEAYNDLIDLNNNEKLENNEIGFNPGYEYYGYFDPYKCYDYPKDIGIFTPTKFINSSLATTDCGGTLWSGNFLNYVTTSRIDVLRKALYGGYRVGDPAAGGATLEGSYVPADAHVWAKTYDKSLINRYAPYTSGTKLFFARINDTNGGVPQLRVLNVNILKDKHGLSIADYDLLRPWHWAGSGRPVARTGIIKPTSADGAILQLTENTKNCSNVDGHKGKGDVCELNSAFPDIPSDTPFSSLNVRVSVCGDNTLYTNDPIKNREQCSREKYKSGGYKPTGLLHDYAAANRVEFGLITGSYQNNLDGGVLRRNIADFKKELNDDNGTFNYNDKGGVKGIAYNLNQLKIADFQMPSLINTGKNPRQYFQGFDYNKCGMLFSPLSANGTCRDWGNPIGEMLAEAMNYFHGTGKGNEAYTYKDTAGAPDLTTETWVKPLDKSDDVKELTSSGNARLYCTKPFNLLISNEQASYDADNVFGPSGMDWATEAKTIGEKETLINKSYFMGENGATKTDKGVPTAKNLGSLSAFRGMPAEPTKGGSYSAAGVAFWGNKTKVPFTADTLQNDKMATVKTMAIALPPTLPPITINGGKITLMPFAKSVKKWKPMDWEKKPDGKPFHWAWANSYPQHPGSTNNLEKWIWVLNGGSKAIDPSSTATQPTSEILDVVFDRVGDNEGTFHVNFADIEQGGDYESDMLVKYDYKYDTGTKKLTVTLTSEFAEGDIEQHAGYVISGVGKDDGLYLDVRDVPDCTEEWNEDTRADQWGSEGSTQYYLDTGLATDNIDGTTVKGTYLAPYAAAWWPWYEGNCANAGRLRPDNGSTRSYTRTFDVPDTATAAQVLKSPLWYAAKWGSFAYDATKKDSTPDDLGDTSKTPNGYYRVDNPKDVRSQINSALNNTDPAFYHASSLAKSDYLLTDSSLEFSGRFSTANWIGDLLAWQLKADGTRANSTPEWSAAIQLGNETPAKRKIYTLSSEFTSSALSDAQLLSLADGGDGGAITDTTKQIAYGKNLVEYLRGDKKYETEKEANRGLMLRTRGDITVDVKGKSSTVKSVLGDIFHSSPVYKKSAKGQPFVIVGANDGMAHVFDATNGKELYAYVPSPLLDGSGSNLGAYTQVGYSHQSYVDGNIAVANITEDSKSMTLAVGSMGFGARALYALDLSDVTSLGKSTAKWEFTHDAMGYNRASPAIVKMNLGGTLSNVVIASSGYNAPAQNGKNPDGTLFILNAKDGKAYHTLSTGVKSGLSEPAIVDKDGDGKADLAYAGDLLGNLWKFDLQDSDKTKWSASKLYSSGQPITSRPTAGPGPDGGVMVYFGTGKYLETNDPKTTTTQSVYGIWDKPGSSTTVEQSKLEKRVVSSDALSRSLKTTDTFPWGTEDKYKMGWYFDLPESRERVIANPEYVNGKLNVITMIPTDSDPQCDGGGKGWIMQLDALYGRAYYQKTLEEIASSNVKLDGINSNFNQYIALTKDGLTAKEDTQGQTGTRTTITDPSLPPGVGSWKQLY